MNSIKWPCAKFIAQAFSESWTIFCPKRANDKFLYWKNSKFIEKDMMSIHCLNSLHRYMTPNKSFHRVTFLWDGRGVYFSMFIWSDCLNFFPAFLNTINEIYWSLYTLKLINMHGKQKATFQDFCVFVLRCMHLCLKEYCFIPWFWKIIN